ncbi:MAG: YfhO family protein, partial [Bacteroidales bacterium]|nr:YfhO family protein [Bacteroidales bacterium]
MGMVNKRYLNGDSFVENRRLKDPFPMTQVDKYILQDTDPNYRVFNLAAGDPFSDARTSYYHKSVGGYHAAKLARYQDLIDRQLSRMSMPVLNMLNTKYFIVPTQEGGVTVEQNPEAMGNAWFVEQVQWVDNADAEMAALDTFDPAYTAVVDKRFAELIDDKAVVHTEGDSIALTSYKPNELRYVSNTAQPRVAVFSEIYFPWGWQVTIDGEVVKEARANYVLRALNIPAGQHEIVFRFDPQSLAVTESIAFASIGGIFLLLIAAVAVPCACRKRKCQS